MEQEILLLRLSNECIGEGVGGEAGHIDGGMVLGRADLGAGFHGEEGGQEVFDEDRGGFDNFLQDFQLKTPDPPAVVRRMVVLRPESANGGLSCDNHGREVRLVLFLLLSVLVLKVRRRTYVCR